MFYVTDRRLRLIGLGLCLLALVLVVVVLVTSQSLSLLGMCVVIAVAGGLVQSWGGRSGYYERDGNGHIGAIISKAAPSALLEGRHRIRVPRI